MRSLIISLIALFSVSVAVGKPAIREQSVDEERTLKMSSHFFVSEMARDYREFVGKSLREIGANEELIVFREAEPGMKFCARPNDVTIRSAFADLVLMPFPASSSSKDYHKGRIVAGKLKDGRGFSILFFEGSPIEASIEVNPDTAVRFRLEKRPNQAPEPTPTAGTSAAEQPLVPAAVVAHL